MHCTVYSNYKCYCEKYICFNVSVGRFVFTHKQLKMITATINVLSTVETPYLCKRVPGYGPLPWVTWWTISSMPPPAFLFSPITNQLPLHKRTASAWSLRRKYFLFFIRKTVHPQELALVNYYWWCFLRFPLCSYLSNHPELASNNLVTAHNTPATT